VVGGENLTEEQKEKRRQQARENGKKGGRLPKYKTAEELEEAINRYFEEHNCKENAPKWHEMLYVIDISDSALLRYRSDEKYIKAGYAEVIKKAEQRHSAFWQQLALDFPNLQTFCIFQLKQPHNGGLSDRQQVDTNNKHQVEIDIKGI
jgi:hypothetical protein